VDPKVFHVIYRDGVECSLSVTLSSPSEPLPHPRTFNTDQFNLHYRVKTITGKTSWRQEAADPCLRSHAGAPNNTRTRCYQVSTLGYTPCPDSNSERRQATPERDSTAMNKGTRYPPTTTDLRDNPTSACTLSTRPQHPHRPRANRPQPLRSRAREPPDPHEPRRTRPPPYPRRRTSGRKRAWST